MLKILKILKVISGEPIELEENPLTSPYYRVCFMANQSDCLKVYTNRDTGVETITVRKVSKPNKDLLPLYFLEKYKNFQKYKTVIENASTENDIPLDLLSAMLLVESGFDSSAKSKTGVRGLAMITKSTARAYGIDRNDPIDSIFGMARILQDYRKKLGYKYVDNRLVVFAYNRGITFARTVKRNQNLYKKHYSKEGLAYANKVKKYRQFFK